MNEVQRLVNQTPDVIAFLRSQVPFKRQPAADSVGSDGGKPSSRPPLNVDAVDAADVELAELALWAGRCGVLWSGFVWRRQGRVVGVLYDDSRPVRGMVDGFNRLWGSGWVEPVGMLEGLQAVRFASLRLWPELDSLFGVEPDVGVVDPVLF